MSAAFYRHIQLLIDCVSHRLLYACFRRATGDKLRLGQDRAVIDFADLGESRVLRGDEGDRRGKIFRDRSSIVQRSELLRTANASQRRGGSRKGGANECASCVQWVPAPSARSSPVEKVQFSGRSKAKFASKLRAPVLG